MERDSPGKVRVKPGRHAEGAKPGRHDPTKGGQACRDVNLAK